MSCVANQRLIWVGEQALSMLINNGQERPIADSRRLELIRIVNNDNDLENT